MRPRAPVSNQKTYINSTKGTVPLVEYMYPVFTRMQGRVSEEIQISVVVVSLVRLALLLPYVFSYE